MHNPWISFIARHTAGINPVRPVLCMISIQYFMIPWIISQSSVTFSEGCRCSSSDDAAGDIREKWLKLNLEVVSYLLWRRWGRHGENFEICSRENVSTREWTCSQKKAWLPNLKVPVFIHRRLPHLLFNPSKTTDGMKVRSYPVVADLKNITVCLKVPNFSRLSFLSR
jgi:hypothetical protein